MDLFCLCLWEEHWTCFVYKLCEEYCSALPVTHTNNEKDHECDEWYEEWGMMQSLLCLESSSGVCVCVEQHTSLLPHTVSPGCSSNLLFAYQLKNNGGRIRVQIFVFSCLCFSPQEYSLGYIIITNSFNVQRSPPDTEKKCWWEIKKWHMSKLGFTHTEINP